MTGGFREVWNLLCFAIMKHASNYKFEKLNLIAA